MTEAFSRLFRDLSDVAMSRFDHEVALNRRLEDFMRAWPADMNVPDFAERFSEVYCYRPKILMAALTHFRNGTSEQRQAAIEIDKRLLAKFISTITHPSGAQLQTLPLERRSEYLQHLCAIIATKEDPTTYIRNQLNPTEQRLVEVVETQRYGLSFAFQAFERGICVVCVALEVAMRAEGAKIAHRCGLTVDYVHWLGRLLRSDVASSWSIWDLPKDPSREALAHCS
jgi:hypothetical protein